MLKSVSKEGHFIPEAERGFRPYLPSHCSGLSEKYHVALIVHLLQVSRVEKQRDSHAADTGSLAGRQGSKCLGGSIKY
jgi:hypothetical protein